MEIQERYRSFCSSLSNLSKSVRANPADDFVLEGTACNFTLTFDLAWKLMKDVLTKRLGFTEFKTGSPRDTLQQAYSAKLIDNDIWLVMLKIRNLLTRDYDGNIALTEFNTIVREFYPKFCEFKDKVENYCVETDEIDSFGRYKETTPKYTVKDYYDVDRFKCGMSAKMFIASAWIELDSRKFAELLMNSPTGQKLYTHESPEMWYGPLYALELVEFDDKFEFPKGEVLPEYLLEWIGYLYFYWCDAFSMTAKEIYKEAPVDLLVKMYEGIHVMSYADQIKNVLERNEMERTGDDLFTVRKRLFGE